MATESDLSNLNIGGNGDPAAAPSSPAAIASPQAPAAAASPAPSATPTATGAASPSSPFSLRAFVQEQGYDPSSFHDERELSLALLRSAQQYEQVAPLADIGRQFAPHADKWPAFQEWQKQQEAEQAKVAAAAAKEQAKPPIDWRKADYDPAWEQHCARDPKTGRYVAQTLDGLQYAEKLNTAEEAMRDNSRDLMTKFPELVDKIVEARLAAKLAEYDGQYNQRWQQNWDARQSEGNVNSWIDQHNKDLFAFDAAGAPIIGADGNQALTPVGTSFLQRVEQLKAMGATDIDAIREDAWRTVSAKAGVGAQGSGPTQVAAPPAQPAQPPRFLSRFAGNTGNNRTQQRGGGLPDPSAPLFDDSNATPGFREIFDRVNGR